MDLSRRDFNKNLAMLAGALMINLNANGEVSLEDAIDKYGKVLFRVRPDAPNQIYMIGQKHVDLDGKIEANVPEVQLEIYRIGQKLIDSRNIGLLIDEGIPYNLERKMSLTKYLKQKLLTFHTSVGSDEDILSIMQGLAPSYLSASSLICSSRNVVLTGAENSDLYKKVLEAAGKVPMSVWDNLNRRRTGEILLNIPKVAAKRKELGEINNLNVLSIIGMAHIDEAINYVERNRIFIEGNKEGDLEEIDMELPLRDLGYGFTAIRPNKLPYLDYIEPQ